MWRDCDRQAPRRWSEVPSAIVDPWSWRCGCVGSYASPDMRRWHCCEVPGLLALRPSPRSWLMADVGTRNRPFPWRFTGRRRLATPARQREFRLRIFPGEARVRHGASSCRLHGHSHPIRPVPRALRTQANCQCVVMPVTRDGKSLTGILDVTAAWDSPCRHGPTPSLTEASGSQMGCLDGCQRKRGSSPLRFPSRVEHRVRGRPICGVTACISECRRLLGGGGWPPRVAEVTFPDGSVTTLLGQLSASRQRGVPAIDPARAPSSVQIGRPFA